MYSCVQAEQEQYAHQLEEKRQRWARDLERRLSLIAWLIGVPALALALLDTTGPVSLLVAICTLVGSLVVGALIYLVINLLTRRGSIGS
jgi:hypothetical protein